MTRTQKSRKSQRRYHTQADTHTHAGANWLILSTMSGNNYSNAPWRTTVVTVVISGPTVFALIFPPAGCDTVICFRVFAAYLKLQSQPSYSITLICATRYRFNVRPVSSSFHRQPLSNCLARSPFKRSTQIIVTTDISSFLFILWKETWRFTWNK